MTNQSFVQHTNSLVAITVLRHIGRESRAETVTEQQEMDIHVSKNAVYEVVRNSYAYDFMLKDNVAYSGTADLESEYEYI